MSDEKNGKAVEKRPEPRLALLIRVEQDGTVNVAGPLQDKILCYGLLGAARKELENHWEKANGADLIARAPAGLLRALPPVKPD